MEPDVARRFLREARAAAAVEHPGICPVYDAGQIDGTRVLRAPWGSNIFFHWIFVHVPHHVDPRIPCYHLEEAADAIDEAFPGRLIDSKLTVRDYISTTRHCKLFDFDSGRWLTYRQAAALPVAEPQREVV